MTTNTGYPCQKGSSAPLILDALKRATHKPGSWVDILYQYKRNASVYGTASYYQKRFPKFRFVGNPTKGRVSLKYVGNK
jgi:hypothetical protein